jgi:hypothetical protein
MVHFGPRSTIVTFHLERRNEQDNPGFGYEAERQQNYLPEQHF